MSSSQTHGSVIGKRLPRKEDARLLTGRGTFVDDVVLPGMLHCRLRPQPDRARPHPFDRHVRRTRPARRAGGVHRRGHRPHQVHAAELLLARRRGSAHSRCSRATRVAYVGDPVAMVVARDRYVAEDAASLVTVDYEEEDPVVTIADAHARAASSSGRRVQRRARSWASTRTRIWRSCSPVRRYLLTRTVRHQRISQSPMETRGVVATKQGE